MHDKESQLEPKEITHHVVTDAPATEILQERFGYEQSLPRTRTLFNMTLMMVAIAAIPYGAGSTFFYPLINGGSPVVFWDWIVMSFIAICLSVSLAEISGLYPLSGGVYYWSFVLSPPRWAPIVSWTTGWLSLIGNMVVCLSINFGQVVLKNGTSVMLIYRTAQLILASVNIFDPTYIAKQWHSVLVTWGLVILLGLIAIYGQKILHHVDTANLGLIIAIILAGAIALPVLAHSSRRSAYEVFVEFVDNGAGWPKGWSYMIGFLQGAYTYSATGLLVSMAEEVKSPEYTIPRALVYGNMLNAVLGVGLLLPILFTLGDVTSILSSATGQPLGEIYLLATGKEAVAFILFLGIILNGIVCGIACSQSASRCIWAFARDGGIPFGHILGRASVEKQLPINAWLLLAAFQMIFTCIYFGSTAAFNAFVSVAVISLGASYMVPVLVSFCRGRRDIKAGAYYKGKIGWFCNVVTILWSIFALPLYSFPSTIPVTQVTMNYASVVFVGFAVMSLVYYGVYGRHHFRGPPAIPG